MPKERHKITYQHRKNAQKERCQFKTCKRTSETYKIKKDFALDIEHEKKGVNNGKNPSRKPYK